jgi:hypothetical protein
VPGGLFCFLSSGAHLGRKKEVMSIGSYRVSGFELWVQHLNGKFSPWKEEAMSRFKIFTLIGLFTFPLGLALVGEAVAGEKIKGRNVWYRVKAEVVNVPGEEGRVFFMAEDKGILTVFQGSKLLDGMALFNVFVLDMNTKTGTGSGHGVVECTDRDGDKIYTTFEAKGVKGLWSGPWAFVRGTGKFEGLRGKATWSSVPVAANQHYSDWEGELEWSR